MTKWQVAVLALVVLAAGALGVKAAVDAKRPRGTDVEKEYLRLFPSVNVSYNLTENLIARVALSAVNFLGELRSATGLPLVASVTRPL